MEELTFAGAGAGAVSQDLSITVNPADIVHEDGPNYVRVLEQAFFQLTSTEEGRALYGDPQRGASIAQSWRTATLLGAHYVCLIAGRQDRVDTDGIPTVVHLGAADVLEVARQLLDGGHRALQVFVHDGRAGHAITLDGWDPAGNSFIYHDPWPGDSLLCAHQNTAGVQAVPAADGLWSVPADQLARVLVAMFVWPLQWADVTGAPGPVAYGTVRTSDFWRFFNLTEAGREQQDRRTVVRLRTGGFTADNSLEIVLDPADRVVGAHLRLRQGWAFGPPYGVNPFALDLAKSFLTAFAPEPDLPHLRYVADAYQLIPDQDTLRRLFADEQFTSTPAAPAVIAYLDPEQPARFVLALTQVQIRHEDHDGQPWLCLSLDVF